MYVSIVKYRWMKFLLLIVIIFLNSCSVFYHSNYFGEVPRRAGSYPRFTPRDSLIGKLDAERAGYDVTSYDLDLKLNPEERSIGGTVFMRFKAVSPLTRIRFDLYKNLKINNVLIGDKELSFTRNERAVYVGLPEQLVPGKEYSIKIDYSGKPTVAKKPPWKGGLVWNRDRNNDPWIGVVCETEGGSIWFPCKDHLSDEPDSVRLRMTVPAGLQVVSNGIMTDHKVNGTDEIFTWETHYPINIYNITFYAGKFASFSDTVETREGTIKLDYYVLPENLERARTHFTQTKDILKFYSETFGPYPWLKEDFKLVEAPFEGMEHQSAIAYGSGYFNLRALGGDYIIVHEAAHEWWGNAVSVSDFSDIWLQEGFATYAEILYAEHKLGLDKSLHYLKYYQAEMINNKLPVVGPRDVNYWSLKDNDVYGKGALILHTIRNVINNDSVFFNILRTFYSEYAKGVHPTTSDFIKVVEKKTANDWSEFFNLYLNHREVPKLEFYYGVLDRGADSSTQFGVEVPFIIARWDRVPDGFKMPAEFYCSETRSDFRINVSSKPEIFFIKNLDPRNHLVCNHILSYFENEDTKALLAEYEYEVLYGNNQSGKYKK
jgi:aminopeptidase N